MIKKILMVLAAWLIVCSVPLSGASAASTKQFSDVPSSAHFAEAVYELAERNIIGGYPDGTFKPGNSITRGQAAAIIAKLIKLDTSKVKDPKFKDVPKSSGYYKAIAAMAEKSIISGYGDGRFGPNDPITRAQMASILVKAFDLPRYDFTSYTSPFDDVKRGAGHDPNIVIIYRLGITTGTAPDRFSPNVPVTRGQASKMLRATEEAKSQIVTVRASDFGWEQFKMFDSNHKDTGVYQAVEAKAVRNSSLTDRIHLVPLKEGDDTFKAALVYSGNPDKKYYRKYYVHVKEVNGKLELTLERTEDFLPSPVAIGVEDKKPVENISLSTMDGKKLSDNLAFTKCLSYSPADCRDHDETDSKGKYRNVHIVIDQPGKYIATIRFDGGEEVRYGIEAVSSAPSFRYSFRILEERPTASLDLGSQYYIGKHVLPKGSEEIADITRDEGTNTFHVVGKKAGAFEVKLPEHKKTDLFTLNVHVEQMGSIIQVEIYEWMDTHM